MSKKDQKVCRNLYHLKHFLNFVSAVSGYVLISAFDSRLLVYYKFFTLSAGIKI